MRADPKRPIPMPAMWEVRDPAARKFRAAVTYASGKPSRCDQLLRRFSWQTDEDK